MPSPEAAGPRPDYGLDAPGVVRNLIVAAVAGLAVWATVALGLWSGTVRVGPVAIQLTYTGLAVGVTCGAMGIYMVWWSRVGKLRERERLLDRITWKGNERVLDVGCGRGLMLLGAARRAVSGECVGVDIWQSVDLSGNRPEATLENARREGVAERVRLETADMRKLPFPDGHFDVIVSKTAVHNLYKREERAQALSEIARVLAPGGTLVLDDIRHVGEYERELRARGLTDVTRVGGPGWPFALVTLGSLNPGTVLARRAR
jgi:SAM-dependent methyltransferase